MVKSHQTKLTEALKDKVTSEQKVKDMESKLEQTKKTATDDFKASLLYKLEDSGLLKLQVSDDETKTIEGPKIDGDNITFLNQFIETLKSIETTWEQTHS